MTLKVIGAGVGRTGTYSLRSALNELELGPTHHMEEVLHHMPVQLPLWQAALQGNADWMAIYKGYQSAVDWPTAGFYRELAKAYPDAKFVLTVRSPESWAESFSETIYTLLEGRDKAPPQMHSWIDWGTAVIAKTGFPGGLDKAELAKAFVAHTEVVKEVIPARNLLIYEVKQGWEPLCTFLGVPKPNTEFPKTNGREEFWERVKVGSAPPGDARCHRTPHGVLSSGLFSGCHRTFATFDKLFDWVNNHKKQTDRKFPAGYFTDVPRKN